jgi:hypothetical protein
MKFRNIAVMFAAAGALGACGGGAELEPADGTGTPIPAQTPIGGEDVEPRAHGGVVDPGEVPDADHDGVPNAQDTSIIQP